MYGGRISIFRRRSGLAGAACACRALAQRRPRRSPYSSSVDAIGGAEWDIPPRLIRLAGPSGMFLLIDAVGGAEWDIPPRLMRLAGPSGIFLLRAAAVLEHGQGSLLGGSYITTPANINTPPFAQVRARHRSGRGRRLRSHQGAPPGAMIRHMTIWLCFTGPPVPITARMHPTPQIISIYHYNIALFYGSSCANNDKDAPNTPDHINISL
eukprot:1195945-Prorocentrum_minimum.AAC.2